jgi:hypothetical protein
MIARLSGLGFRMIELNRFFYDVRDGTLLALEAWFDRPSEAWRSTLDTQ